MERFSLRRWLRSLVRTQRRTLRKSPHRPQFIQLEDRLAPASTFQWSGAGANDNWATGANWIGGVAPTGGLDTFGIGDDLIFPPLAARLNNINNLGGAVFNSISISGSGYTLRGNDLTLGALAGGTGYLNATANSAANAVNFDITLGGAANTKQFFTVGTLTSFLTINGEISGNTGVELSKDGQGTLILAGDNSGFTGPITITENALRIRHPNALGNGSTTTVLFDTNAIPAKFGQLQFENVDGDIDEQIIINGTGPLNDGALLNVAGDNVITGNIRLDQNSIIGANAGSLTIEGEITEGGIANSLTKEGPAQIIFDPLNNANGNSYQGQTFVNNGILTIRHSLALGNDLTPVFGFNDTVVNSFTNRSGTLQLEFDPNPARIDANATGSGFAVPLEALTLNGPGSAGIHVVPKQSLPGGATVIGALNNRAGQNRWVQDISLWSGNSAMLGDPIIWSINGGATGLPTVGIGAETGAQLTISGRIIDDNITNTTYSLFKSRPGRVILAAVQPGTTIAAQNTYRGRTEVLEGFLNIRDSEALGASGSIANGTEVFPGGTLELEADTIPDSNPAGPAPDGTPHLNTDIVITNERLSISGNGAGGNGALRNIRGTNENTGITPLTTFIDRFGISFSATGATIGVEPDRAPYTSQFNLSQLTLSGVVSGGSLTKVGTGELVLTANNTFGTALISEGWVTIRHNNALGQPSIPDTITVATTVAEGAAVVLKQTRTFVPANINVPERFFLSGDGIRHRTGTPGSIHPELQHRGALLNLSGDNIVSGIVNLVGSALFPRIGLGADIANSEWVPADLLVTTSTLTFTNLMQEGAGSAVRPGIDKLGRKRVVLQGPGTFLGDNEVSEGVLRIQNDLALGMITGTTTVEAGTALEFDGFIASQNGGLTGGIQVRETFVLADPGNLTADDDTHDFTNPILVHTLTNRAQDNHILGAATFVSDINIGVRPDSRLSLWQSIGGPGGISKFGAGKLVFGGVNNYDGVTHVLEGTLNLQSSSALGSPLGGTIIDADAQIELQGDVFIGGETLTVLGDGPSPGANIPLRWFGQGPGPILTGQTVGNENVTGRVTGVAVNPADPNVMYLSAAGGGAWRTKNGGLTWHPLIDNIGGLGVDEVLFTGAITIAPDNRTLYVALGESNNSTDSYYGRGVLRSTDGGETWTLLPQPLVNGGFDRRSISKIVVDPLDSSTIYVAVSGAPTNGVAYNNGGIWRFDGTAWTNLIQTASPARTALNPSPGPGPEDDNNITFLSTDHYTDVVVFDDELTPGFGGNRFIAFSIGNPGGTVRSNVNGTATGIGATYISIAVNPASITAGIVWTRSGFTVSDTVNNVLYPHNGFIKTAGGFTPDFNNGVGGTNWLASYTLYSAVTWPSHASGTRGTFREIWRTTITWDRGNLRWVVNNWATTAAPGNYQGTLGEYGSVIAVHPADVNYVFVAGVGQTATPGPFVSTNGGGAWTDIGNTAGDEPHVDYHAVTWEGRTASSQTGAASATARLVVGNDGGIWRLNNRTPGSIQWNNLNGNFLQISQFAGLDVHPFNPFGAAGGTNYFGTPQNGTHITSGSPFWDHGDDGDGGITRINNINPNIIFHLADGTLRRSLSGGTLGTWANIGTGVTANYFILDRVNPARLVIAGTSGLVRESADSGSLFPAPTFNTIGSFGDAVTLLAISDRQGVWANDTSFPLVVDRGADSYDSDTVYAVTFNTTTGLFSIRVTKNHGTSWQVRNTGLTRTGISDVHVDPRHRDTAYLTRSVFDPTGGHVFWTSDAGQNWTDISGDLPNLPTWKVVVNPRNGDVYAGTDNGVYVLRGGPVAGGPFTWVRLGVGMPNVQIKELVYNSFNNTLAAGTYGRGMFRMWLDDSRDNGGALRAVTGSSTWSGNINLVGNANIRAEVGAQLTFAGIIADANTGDNWQIDKFGQGRVVFSGSNTFGGDVIVREGALVARNLTALGTTVGDTTVVAGAALELQADLANEFVQLNGDGIRINGHFTGALRNVSNNNTFTGELHLFTNSTIGVDSNSTLTIGTKAGIPGAGRITEQATFDRDLTKELTGTLILNTENFHDGITRVIQGALRVEHALALGGIDPVIGPTNIHHGGQLQLANNVTVAAEQLNLSGTGIVATGALLNFAGNNAWNGVVALTGLQGVTAPPPPVPPANVSIGVVGGTTLTIRGQVTETDVIIPALPPTIPVDVPIDSFGLTKVGLGTLVLAGTAPNDYTGVTTVQSGVLNIQKAQALGTIAAGTVVLTNAALELQDPVGAGITFTAEPLTINADGIVPARLGALRNVQGANTWTGTITVATTSNIGVDAGTQLVVQGVNRVSSVSAVDLRKVGPGRLVFNNDNNGLVGRVLINDGALAIRTAHGLGAAGSQPTIVASGASLQLENIGLANPVADETLTINGLGFAGMGALENFAGSNVWTRQILLGSDSAIGSDVGNAAYPPTGFPAVNSILRINAAIVDGGAAVQHGVTKVGPGILAYDGTASNTYDGLTKVGQGVLLLNKTGGALPFGANLEIGELDSTDPDFSAVAALAQNNEVPNGAITTVFKDGLLDLYTSDVSDTIDTVVVNDGHVNIGDGNLTVTDLTIIDGDFDSATGDLTVANLNMTGGRITLAAATGQVVLTGNVTATSSATQTAEVLGAGVIQLNGLPRTFNVGNGPLDVDFRTGALIAGGAGAPLVKTGAGVMEIDSAVNTYVGLTDIRGGVVKVDGAILGNVFLQTDGTLSGHGTVQGSVTGDTASEGNVAPGSSPGILTTGPIVWNPATTFVVDLDTTTPGTGHDQLIVNGDLNLDGAQLVGLVSANVALNDVFTIIDYTGTRSGEFAAGEFIFIDGKKFDIVYDDANTEVRLQRIKADATITVTSNQLPAAVWGQNVLFTITVTPESLAGVVPPATTVEIRLTTADGTLHGPVTVPLTGGQFSFDINEASDLFGLLPLEVTDSGPLHIVEARLFDPTDTFVDYEDDFSNPGALGRTFATHNQDINKGDTTTTLTSSAPSNQSVYGQSVTITATLGILPPAGVLQGTNIFDVVPPASQVTFFVDSVAQTPIDVTFTGSAYIAQLVLANLTVGAHVISAQFSGDAHFNGSTTATDLVQTVLKGATTTLVEVTNPIVPPYTDPGQFVEFTVTVSPVAPSVGTPTGSVVLSENGGSFAVQALSGGQAVFLITTLTSGIHNIRAEYLGELNYNGSFDFTTHKVRAVPNVGVSIVPPNFAGFGQQIDVNVTLSPTAPFASIPTGDVELYDENMNLLDTGTLVGGQAALQTSVLTIGAHTLHVVYVGGDANYTGRTVSVPYTIKGTTNLVITSNSPRPFGQTATIGVDVEAELPATLQPTGVVEFRNGATLLGQRTIDGSGQASINVSGLPVGVHNITINYLGDTNYVLDSETFPFTVTGNVSMSIASSLNPSVFGQLVNFTVNVGAVNPALAAPSGDVDLYSNGNFLERRSLSGGSVVFPISNLPGGDHVIVAQYVGNGAFNPNQATLAPLQHVNPAGTVMTAVTSTPGATIYGEQITFSTTVASTGPTPVVVNQGTVTFTFDGGARIEVVPVVGGVASLQITNLSAGTHVVTAAFTGTVSFLSSSAPGSRTHVVQRATTSMALDAIAPNPAQYGQPAIRATLTPQILGVVPSGNIIFTVTNTVTSQVRTFSAPIDANSQALLPSQAPGSYTVSASYSGDANFFGSSASAIPHSVVKGVTTLGLTTNGSPGYFGAVVIRATLTPDFGAGTVPSGVIVFDVTDTATSQTTTHQVNITAGQATLPITLNVGTYEIVAHYAGDDNYLGDDSDLLNQEVLQATSSIGVASSLNPSSLGQLVTFTATVVITQGGTPPTGDVDFIIDGGAPIRRPIGGGTATLAISNLSVGLHTVAVNYVPSTTNIAPASGSLTGSQQVTQGASSVGVVSSAPTATTGASVDYTITVAAVAPAFGTPTGNVFVSFDGGVATQFGLSGGQVVVSHAWPTQGVHTVQVQYVGDGNFLASQQTINQVVKSLTTTALVSSDTTTVFGEPVLFTATVQLSGAGVGVPTGTVRFIIDGGAPIARTLAGGSVSLSRNDLGVGIHSIRAEYQGDSNFQASAGDLPTQTVTIASATLDLTSSDTTSVVGQSVTFTAIVLADSPSTQVVNGSVTFFDVTLNQTLATIQLSAGQATFTTTDLSLGNHNIRATYDGSASFAGGSQETVLQQVSAAATFVSLQTSLNPSIVGQAVTFTATVSVDAPGSGTPAGSVTFFDVTTGTTLAIVNVAGGQARLTTTGLGVGNHVIRATFNSSTASFTGSPPTQLTQTVTPNPLQIAVPASVKSGAPFTVVVRKLKNGAPDASFNGPVTISLAVRPVPGTLTGTLTVNAIRGVATFTGLRIDRAANGYRLRAVGAGLPPSISGLLAVTASRLTATIAPAPPVINQPFTATLTARDITNAPAANYTGQVTIQVTKQPIGSVVSGNRTVSFVNGVARFPGLRVSKIGTYEFKFVRNGVVVAVLTFASAGHRLS